MEFLNLKKDKTLVIKESDKGRACIIIDEPFYNDKISEMLNDRETYKELDKNIDAGILRKICKLTLKYKEQLTSKEIQYLTKFDHQMSQFYGLPKIHKFKIIKDKIKENPSEYVQVNQPQDLKMRPIVAGPNCVTSRLSNFLDILMQPFLKKVKSFVRDDIDFLEKLPRNTDDKKILLTLDVTNMYTNIDNKLGKEAIKYWLEKYPELIPRGIWKEFILEGLSVVLEFNTFTFNGRNYLQIKGVSMGTKLAPMSVNLVMAYLEIKLYQIIRGKYGKEIMDQFVKEWLRYLDDCFLNWDLTVDTTENLLKILHSLYPSIKFETEESETEANYLDIKILVKDHKIITDLFEKPTDSQHYVPFISSHPSHTKRNIPFNLARRICTMVEEGNTRDQRLTELKYTPSN